MMIKPGKWKVKNELQNIVEKLVDLKLQKTETSMEIFYLEFFFSSYRNFQTILYLLE